jgi:hypothetical protein
MTYQSKYPSKSPDQKAYPAYPDGGSLHSSRIKKGPKSPDYFGTIAINLKDMTNIKTEDGLTVVKLSGWKRAGNDGKTFLSIAVDRFIPEPQGGGSPRQPTRQEDDFGDDSNLPF